MDPVISFSAQDWAVVAVIVIMAVIAFSLVIEYFIKRQKLAQKEQNLLLKSSQLVNEKTYVRQYWTLVNYQKQVQAKVENLEAALGEVSTDEEISEIETRLKHLNSELQRIQDELIELRMLIRKAEGVISLWQDGDPHPIREMSKWKFTRERRLEEYKKRGILGEGSLAIDGSIRDWRDQRRLA